MLWVISPSRIDRSTGSARLFLAALRLVSEMRDTPVVLVLFDTAGDPDENAKLVRERLDRARIHLVVAIDSLHGERLRFLTRFGVLQPPFDHYAARVGAPHQLTLRVSEPDWPTGLSAFPETPLVVVRGDAGDGARTSDAAALVGYVLARFAARAPELLR